jgi:tetratricopeptide (TPR) repeat protein
MIETVLVYIYSAPTREFIGCGALVEGGYIATCRHVWRDAVDSESEEPQEVEIEFPFAQDNTPGHRAMLADKCEGLEARVPDLVLLRPDRIPEGILRLQLARETEFETGQGQCHCCLQSRGVDSYIDGEIKSRLNTRGMRQFTGGNGQSHWMEEGSSGSPVFLKERAQQLAGIIALAEIALETEETRKHEAFIVPATTIHKYLRAYLERQAAQKSAEKRGIDPGKLQPILAKLGEENVPDAEITGRLDAAVEAILAQSKKPVTESNDGADIEAVIASSRAKLGELDTAGALDVLQAKIAQEEAARIQRLVPLLKERAAVERLSFNYDGAKKSLREAARLAPDDVWAFIGLGDLYVTTGPLNEAEKAYRGAEAAARRAGRRARSFGFL